MTIAHPTISPDSPAARRALAAIQAEVDRIRPAGAAVAPRPFRTAEERDGYLGFCATMAAEWILKATRAAGSAVKPPADRPGIPAATPPPPDPGDPASGGAEAAGPSSRVAAIIDQIIAADLMGRRQDVVASLARLWPDELAEVLEGLAATTERDAERRLHR